MVTVNFKLTGTAPVLLEVNGSENFENILERCATQSKMQIDGIIAVRKDKVLSARDLVRDLDEIDVFPALSGG